jgi:hypothetical protein
MGYSSLSVNGKMVNSSVLLLRGINYQGTSLMENHEKCMLEIQLRFESRNFSHVVP